VPESFLGDGLVYEELLPIAWTSGALAEGLVLVRLNADNHQLLGAVSSLDEVRVSEALKEESAALLHELQRLEYKINILLRLTADIAMRNSGVPPAEKVRLSSRALEWFGERTPKVGASGLLSVYINPALPQPVKIPCTVDGERMEGGAHVAQLRFVGLSEPVIELLDKLIFRHHRRLVAGARGAPIDLDSTLRPTKIR
jgi:hypothetical protein